MKDDKMKELGKKTDLSNFSFHKLDNGEIVPIPKIKKNSGIKKSERKLKNKLKKMKK